MDVFAGFQGRVLAAVQQLKHDGVVPHEASMEGIILEPPKDASHGDLPKRVDAFTALSTLQQDIARMG